MSTPSRPPVTSTSDAPGAAPGEGSSRVVTLTAGRAAHVHALQFGFASHRGLNPSRRVNEDAGGWAELGLDASGACDDVTMVLVADGVGGMAGGAEASATVAAVLLQADPPPVGLDGPAFSHWLAARVLEADAAVRAAAVPAAAMQHVPLDSTVTLAAPLTGGAHGGVMSGAASAARPHGRSTVTAVALRGERFCAAHVGDSRAYLASQGRVVRLTNDHTLLGSLVAEGHLSEAEAARRPGRNPLLRAVGSLGDTTVGGVVATVDALDDVAALGPEPEQRLLPSESLVLLTDGVWSVVPLDAMAAVVTSAPSAQAVADRLIELALAAGGPDNATVAVVTRVVRGQETNELRVWPRGTDVLAAGVASPGTRDGGAERSTSATADPVGAAAPALVGPQTATPDATSDATPDASSGEDAPRP